MSGFKSPFGGILSNCHRNSKSHSHNQYADSFKIGSILLRNNIVITLSVLWPFLRLVLYIEVQENGDLTL